ncbi:unnamed protein product [marine sediment metagenome]|uniref:Uncharacterized protein n=1 Tax=marine sediment metagenome TaxID=412755 RepID=X1JF82_9ZZZZ
MLYSLPFGEPIKESKERTALEGMTLEKAIEILDVHPGQNSFFLTPKRLEALKLGIEAMKSNQEIDSVLGEFSDSEDYDLVSDYWKRRLFCLR